MVWIWKVFGPSDSFHGSLFFASTSQSSLLFFSLNLDNISWTTSIYSSRILLY